VHSVEDKVVPTGGSDMRRLTVQPSVVRAVASSVRAEVRQFSQFVLGQPPTDSAIVGNDMVEEAAVWQRECPVQYQILAHAVRAPSLHCAPSLQRARVITLRGTGVEHSLPHSKTDFAARRQTDLSLLRIDRKNLRLYCIGSMLSNTLNPRVSTALMDNTTNLLFNELTVEAWRYLNTLGVVISRDKFFKFVKDIVQSGKLKMKQDGTYPVMASFDNLDFDGAKQWYKTQLMHLITTQYVWMPGWAHNPADVGEWEMQPVITQGKSPAEIDTLYERMYSANLTDAPKLAKLQTDLLKLATPGAGVLLLKEQLAKIFAPDSDDAAAIAAEQVQ